MTTIPVSGPPLLASFCGSVQISESVPSINAPCCRGHWTFETLIAAEELGITSANAKDMAATDKRPEVQQLLGQRYGTGTQLDLDPQWGLNVLEAEGNYGELFERTLGPQSRLRITRGEDRLWTEGTVVPDLPNVH